VTERRRRRGAAPDRLTALDGLRGIAALGVALFWHYRHFAPETLPFRQVAYWPYHYGDYLVDMFFVLSGCVFTFVYRDRIRAGAVSLGRFAALRLSRLYPLHAVTLCIVAVLQAVHVAVAGSAFVYPENDVQHFIYNALFLQAGWLGTEGSFNGPSWSVAVEVIAYLLFFAVLVLTRTRTAYLVAFGLLFVGGLALRTHNLFFPIANWQVARVLIGFFVGCLAFELHQAAARAGKSRTLAVGAAAALAAMTTVGLVAGHDAFGRASTVYVVAFFPALILLVLNVRALAAVVGSRPLAYLGAISYSVYMAHFPVQLALVTLNDGLGLGVDFSTRWAWTGYTALVLGVSVASYHLLERPIQARLRRRPTPELVEQRQPTRELALEP
jgi:peptidoglycan/LPS O-acetylase OafA/YrhL